MAKFKVAVEWEMFGEVEVEAESLVSAVNKVRKNPDDFDLPVGSYVDGSFKINTDMSLQKGINVKNIKR